MHLKTKVFILALVILIAILTSIRIRNYLTPASDPQTELPISTASAEPTPESLKSYNHKNCGVSFFYPGDFEVLESTNAARLSDTNSEDYLNLACSQELPRPPLPEEKIEETTINNIKATVYHDQSARDGTPVDVVMFAHPRQNLEVAIFGFGDTLAQILETLSFRE